MFTAETKVLIWKKGAIPITEVKAGDKVWTITPNGLDWVPCSEAYLVSREVSVIGMDFGGREMIVCSPMQEFIKDYLVEFNDNNTSILGTISDKKSGTIISRKAIDMIEKDLIPCTVALDDRRLENDIFINPTWSGNGLNQIGFKASIMQSAYRDIWALSVPGVNNFAVCTEIDSKPRCAQWIYRCIFAKC